jgi:hypothetical protein
MPAASTASALVGKRHFLMLFAMKSLRAILASSAALVALVLAGCATAPKTVTLNGQIFLTDSGKIQKTGLTPIWIYDVTNSELTTQIPLPNFGGRGRADLTRIRKDYPAVLTVCSNYQAACDKFPAAEIKYRDLNQQFDERKNALHGQTNGPEFEAVQRLRAETASALEARDQAIDESDDARELIFYWFNVNPGILYGGLPRPLATAQTDTNGEFSITLPKDKNFLVVAHIEGSINGEPGHYFIRWPLTGSWTGARNYIFDNSSACVTKRNSELKPMMIYVLLDNGNGGLGLSSAPRNRDTQMKMRPYWKQYYSQPN